MSYEQSTGEKGAREEWAIHRSNLNDEVFIELANFISRYQARSISDETGTWLSTSTWLATNQHDKEYRKEERYSNAFGSVYAASWRPKGCVASEICHPDVNQYFVGFVRAPPNQPSVQPLLPSPYVSSSIYLSLFLFRVRGRVMRARQMARRNLQARVCDHHVEPTTSPFFLSVSLFLSGSD